MSKNILNAYLKSLHKAYSAGDAREESFYFSLEKFITQWAQLAGKDNIQVTALPKKTEAGNPDFRIWDGQGNITGYIEAKHPSHELLDKIEHTEQLKRYLSVFPNVILTNFFEFRLYRQGQLVDKTILARPYVMTSMNMVPPIEDEKGIIRLLERFFDFSMPGSTSARDLAVELAKRTRLLRGIVLEELDSESEQDLNYLKGFHDAFKTHFMSRLSKDDFSDLYAQTISYGLFAARTRAGDDFTRKHAFELIPKSIGVLRDVFHFISLGDPPRQLEWMVDDIAQVLARTDVNHILDEYFHQGRGSDPIVHFYETFLAEYNPEERQRRGVYYTPEPVVGFIVRSVHQILRQEFGYADGLASDKVTILDPAAGTMTFIARACMEAVGEFERNYGSGAGKEFIRSHILKNFFAFELMMAPYAIGHLKMSFFLEELGCALGDRDRMKFYLTNALEMEELEQTTFPIIAELAKESKLAGEVKRRQPVLAVMGNPPYSGHSSNTGKWITSLIKDYKEVDGKPLGEKNPKWLQDDYVKFIRLAQNKIDRTGKGVVAMITNHSYLDNPTFRGMRKSLMDSFDHIYVLDLHGNSLKKEKCPDGSKDENVFDIRQGVAIAFFIKTGKKDAEKKISHADLWGTRDEKYEWLDGNTCQSIDWERINPMSEFYFFKPRDEAALKDYQAFPSIRDIFSVSSVGVVTARDKLTIHETPEKTWRIVNLFYKSDTELARAGYNLGRDTRDWKVSLAQKDIKDSGPDRNRIVPILYRPFDLRYTYYTGRSRGFICMPRPEIMRHMFKQNLALTIVRQVKTGETWQHSLVSSSITESCYLSNSTSEISYLLPLYLYPNNLKNSLLNHIDPDKRLPNLTKEFLETIAGKYGFTPAPEQILYYIYAVLYAPAYRDKYSQFLKSDFPRIPFTRDKEIFQALSEMGERLVKLHLLESDELSPPLVRFEGDGDCLVAKTRDRGFYHDPDRERMHINKDQYFEPVEEDIYQYRIGGYQVLDKWLKDRKERRLTLDEIKNYCRTATAIIKTVEIQKELDDVYLEAEKRNGGVASVA
jgi:type I restriction-modification system DNA methylase subunit